MFEVKDTVPLYSQEFKHLTSAVERVFTSVEVYLDVSESEDTIIELLNGKYWSEYVF